MDDLGAVISARLDEWAIDDLPLERALFGTAVPGEIAAAVDTWCRAHLGAAIEQYEFFDSSSGSVHGVRLTDGQRVVVKGHRPAVSRAFLDAIGTVQQGLADTGFPAPRPLVAATPVGQGHLTAEVMLPAAGDVDGHDPAIRRVLAVGLADLVAAADAFRPAFAGTAHPMAMADDELYPRPHSARYDFAATAEGAEWIDTLAAAALDRLISIPDGRWVVIHGDWRIDNVGISDGRLIAVYDWDSVQVQREPIAFAIAAMTFCVAWSRPAARGSRSRVRSRRSSPTTRMGAGHRSPTGSVTCSPRRW